MECSTAGHLVAIIFYLVGLGLIVTSQVTIAWIGNDNVMYGLYQQCRDVVGCDAIDWSTDPETLEFFVSRVVLLLADVFVIAGFLAALIALCLKEKQKKVCITSSGSFNIVAGIIVWSGGAAFTAINLLVFPNSADQTYHYGFAFCWAAGFLFFFGGIFDVMDAAREVELSPSQPVVERFEVLPAASAPPPYNLAYETTPPLPSVNEKFSY